MRTLLVYLVWLIASVSGRAGDESTIQPLVGPIQPLVGREFSIHDDWAGQELAFRNKGGSIFAVWRILGSGQPVLSEVEYPVEVKSPWLFVFEVHLRDESRNKLTIKVDESSKVHAYLNGVRIEITEKKPN